MSFEQAKQLIVKTGGTVSSGEGEIPIRKADVLPLEQNFENTYPLYRERKDCFLTDTFELKYMLHKKYYSRLYQSCVYTPHWFRGLWISRA